MQAWSQLPGEIDFHPISQESLNNPEAEDWLMWRGGYEKLGL